MRRSGEWDGAGWEGLGDAAMSGNAAMSRHPLKARARIDPIGTFRPTHPKKNCLAKCLRVSGLLIMTSNSMVGHTY